MNIVRRVRSFFPWAKLAWTAKLQPHEIGLICPCGIGDTYFVCALAKEISRVNQDLAIVAIAKQQHQDIPALFSDSITRTVTFQSRQIVNSAAFARQLAPGKLFFAHPSVNFCNGKIDLVGYKQFNLLDSYRFTFKLDEAAALSSPTISQEIRKSAKKKMTDYGLPPAKTVILAPDSSSTPNLTNIRTDADDFWYLVAQKLAAQGYTVTLLTNRNDSFLPQIPRIEFPLREAIPLAEMCGWVIAARSGLCDLLATAKTKLTILYPEHKWYSGTVYTTTSLQLMGLNQSASEIVVDRLSNADIIADKIMADREKVYHH